MVDLGLKNGQEANLAELRKDATRLGLPIKKRISGKELLRMVRAEYDRRVKELPPDKHVHCEECGEITDDDESLNRCPFCAFDGIDPKEAAKIAKTNGSNGSNGNGSNGHMANLLEVSMPEVIDIGDPEEEEEEKEAATKLVKTKVKPVKPAKVSAAEDDDETDPAKLYQKWLAKFTAAAQDEIGGAYDKAYACMVIRDKNLWTQHGQAKSFHAWIQRMKLKRSYIYELITLVERHTREEFLEVGPSKLILIGKFPELERAKALERARKKQETVKSLKEKLEVEKGTVSVVTKFEEGKPLPAKLVDAATGKPVAKWKRDECFVVEFGDVWLYMTLKVTRNKDIVGAQYIVKRKAEPLAEEVQEG